MCDSLHLNKRVYLSQVLLLSHVLLHFDLIVIVLSDEIEPSSLCPRHGFGGRGCGAESLPNQYKLYICINSDEIYDIKLLCCALKKKKIDAYHYDRPVELQSKEKKEVLIGEYL